MLTTVFDEQHEEMVIVRDIPLYSTCEHHLVPWHGVAHVGYIPNDPGSDHRPVEAGPAGRPLRARPQVQERLTTQVADALVDGLSPRGVIVVVEAEHLCMSMRGVRKPGSRTVTSAVRGLLQHSPSARAEAMGLILRRS